jgi:hypothetical protein
VGTKISEQCPTTLSTINDMAYVPCVSVVGILMHAMVCTRPNIDQAMGVLIRFMANFGREHWAIVNKSLGIFQALLNIPFSIIVMF